MRTVWGTARRVRRGIGESARSVQSLERRVGAISRACRIVVSALRKGRKILTAGNGGSAAEALHMAEELVGRFRSNRRSLPGLALVADTTALTCIGNDFGFDRVFSRQVEGYGARGDVLVLFSTSGSGENLRLAARAARAKGMKLVCVLGRDGGKLRGLGDCEIVVEGNATERIQEAHQTIMHLILEEVEAAWRRR